MGRNPEPPQDLVTYIKKLERRIENLERSQRITNTSIDEGSVIVNNGAVVSKHPNGVELFRAGKGETVLPFEVDPTPGYLTRVKRGNGQTVLEVFTDDDGGESRLTVHDRNGNKILTEDWLIGKGLDRPYIPWTAYKISDWLSPPVSINSATFSGAYLIEGNIQHPALYTNTRIIADAGTAGDIRLQDTFFGTTMWSDTIATAFNGNKSGVGNLHGFRNYGDNASFEIQIRRTAGTGNIRAQFVMAYGQNAVTL